MINLKRIAVIGVNYASEAAALRFAASLSRVASIDSAEVKLIIVDNSDTNDRKQLFLQINNVMKDAICVKSPRNLGYFGGARLGLQTYNDLFGVADWTIICNVDIEFNDPDFFQKLPKCPAADIGVIAPAIISVRASRDLNPYMPTRPAREQMLIYKYLFSNYFLSTAYETLAAAWHIFYRKDIHHNKSGNHFSADIYAPHGSCIIFSKSYFQSGCDLNYPIFLFNEEVFVAESAAKNSLRIVYLPLLRVTHSEHVTTGTIRSKKIAARMAESSKYIYNQYFKKQKPTQ